MKIPSVETYRGVEIHDHQSPARIATVKRQIDHLLDAEHTPVALADIAVDPANAPETRLLAAGVLKAIRESRRVDRQALPVDFDVVDASVAGLDLEHWRDPWRFGVLFDDAARAVPRESALPGFRDLGGADAEVCS